MMNGRGARSLFGVTPEFLLKYKGPGGAVFSLSKTIRHSALHPVLAW